MWTTKVPLAVRAVYFAGLGTVAVAYGLDPGDERAALYLALAHVALGHTDVPRQVWRGQQRRAWQRALRHLLPMKSLVSAAEKGLTVQEAAATFEVGERDVTERLRLLPASARARVEFAPEWTRQAVGQRA